MQNYQPTAESIRFEAEWVNMQYRDKNGEWDPDRDEFAASYHATKKAAERAGITAGKKADQCEWVRVTEQKYIGREWVDQRYWIGDWDGLHDVNFSAE